MARAQAGVKHEKTAADVCTFFDGQPATWTHVGDAHAAADDGPDAPASRPSRPPIAAALARHLGRVGHRLAAPTAWQ